MLIDVNEAASRLPDLIERACAGEEVILSRDTVPLVRLVPVSVGRIQAKREFGSLKGKLVIPEELFRPLSSEEMDAWGQ
jgi:antitoxin (DNA-binding transcriptional repressor) of toxin-antitoxin stability system